MVVSITSLISWFLIILARLSRFIYLFIPVYYRLDEDEFEQALGVGDGQGGLACCSPRGHKATRLSARTELILFPQGHLSLHLSLGSGSPQSVWVAFLLFCVPAQRALVICTQSSQCPFPPGALIPAAAGCRVCLCPGSVSCRHLACCF